jgi:hypothetical protein
MKPEGTTIISPSGTPGGNALSPGFNLGQFLPHGVVIPHNLPLPENFRLPQIAFPSAVSAAVPSIVTLPPGASDDGIPRLGVQRPALPKVVPPQALAGRFTRVRYGAVKSSRNTVGRLPEFVRRPVSKLGENAGKARVRALGIRWG